MNKQKNRPNIEGRYQIQSQINDGMHPADYHRIIDNKTNALLAIIDDIAMANGLINKLNSIDELQEQLKTLNTENDRLVNALDYILESGSISSYEAEQKAKWGLGLMVEDETFTAALKPRFS